MKRAGMFCWVLLACLSCAQHEEAVGSGGTEPGEGLGTLILSEENYWRAYYAFRTPLVREGADIVALGSQGKRKSDEFFCQSPLPPADWISADFNDANWSLWRTGRLNARSPSAYERGSVRYGDCITHCLSLLCLRGKFEVTDPPHVQGLKLSLSYRGGVVVYVNGKEIARQHLPPGEITLETLGAEYPDEAFLRPDGSSYQKGDYGPFADRQAVRIRCLTITVPVSELQKGANVLALEFHRTPYRVGVNTQSHWSTCGLVRLELRAQPGAGIKPRGSAPEGLQVFTANSLRRVLPYEFREPYEPLQPVRLVGVRNGTFNAQVLVRSDKAIQDLKAEASDLHHISGAETIPASAAGILYKLEGRGRDIGALSATPPDVVPVLTTALTSERAGTFRLVPIGERGHDEAHFPGGRPAALQSLWLKIRIPADAAPGDYRGMLAVGAAGADEVEVPIRLKVHDWTLPDPRDFVPYMGLIQSPTTIALQYNVPLWSEEHFKYMEKSYALMQEVGAKNIYITFITRTNFGNDQSMVRWVREPDGSYRGDFSVMERYLNLVQRYLKPRVVCLYAWDIYMGGSGGGGRLSRHNPNLPPKVSLVDPVSGRVKEVEGPPADAPEAYDFWKPILLEAKARLEKRGLGRHLLLGLSDDFMPTKEVLTLFNQILPGMRWVQNSHGAGDGLGRLGVGTAVGYCTVVYWPWRAYLPERRKEEKLLGWNRDLIMDAFPRFVGPGIGHPMYIRSHLAVHRIIAEGALLTNLNGLGRTGVDFWPVIKARKGMRSISARYPETTWNQLNLGTGTAELLAPGPDGAITTDRFEMIRAGVQGAQARVFLEKALFDEARRAQLGEELAKRAQAVLDERLWLIRSACVGAEIGQSDKGFEWCEGSPWTELPDKLFSLAAEVEKALHK